MAKPNILVVDSDEGFGNMLKEGLENSGYYDAYWAQTGRDALQVAKEQSLDLIIIDVAVSDMSPLKLMRAIRDAKPDVRIMLIPPVGREVPPQVKKLNIDGILTKPFFVGDLPAIVDKALGIEQVRTPAPVQPAAPSSTDKSITPQQEEDKRSSEQQAPAFTVATVPQETISYLRSNESEILRLLDDLNREVRAEAILLIAGQELIAQAGMLRREQCRELTLLVAQSSQAAAQAAKFLGERAGRFIQSLHEGAEYRLYTLTLAEGILLSIALSSNVPLGMIRHQCRQIADQLSRYIN